jgi:hypothetical protein
MPEPRQAISSIMILPLLLLPMRAALAQLAETNFASVPCHVAFAYPSTWEVVRDTADPQSDCNFMIRPKDWQQRLVVHDSVDLYTISLAQCRGGSGESSPGQWIRATREPVGHPGRDQPAGRYGQWAGLAGAGTAWAAPPATVSMAPTRDSATCRRRSSGTRAGAWSSSLGRKPRTCSIACCERCSGVACEQFVRSVRRRRP